VTAFASLVSELDHIALRDHHTGFHTDLATLRARLQNIVLVKSDPAIAAVSPAIPEDDGHLRHHRGPSVL
jgi:hypothetical protein